ncbi:sugar ABC transporter permease [Streptomyces abyssalis]|uniref:Sugar ABC transporter permease n=1 Tax=Streptomyces abyssalis TaxID=933944 RepID=A0A1E7JQ37_9ACTN|nr:sugar ABC transporter permease [Streptomyces abyssalis]OEU90402.1 sugar ABC transporter permease [Streptomyces abyssalis]OEU95139.1 sugar ABC transporter permease [Streptomyces abyssalis]OEV13880.1 sugar ABC transporter permease [Streptomyces nanshensis]
MSLTPPWRRGSGPTARSNLHGEGRMAAFLVSPTLLVLGLVIAYPVLSAVHSSLYSVPDIDPETGFVEKGDPFVGLDNFTAIFSGAGDRFWNAFWNTSFLTGTSVILETVIGLAMALIMHQGLRGRAWVRASILVPWAIPTAISALLWRWIFDSEGIANSMLNAKILWTTEGFQAQVAVIIAEVWKTAPFVGILVLAGLQIISNEVYEAARVDGAGPIRRLWSITLPLVKPALLVAVLFRLLDALRMFDLPYILIGAGKHSVETLSMLAQDEASNVRFGPASAYSVILFLYVFLIAFAFIKLLGADLLGARDEAGGGKGARKRRSRVAGDDRNPQKEAIA